MPSYASSIRNLRKAVEQSSVVTALGHGEGEEESEMVRRYVFWWMTCRNPNKPIGRDWARQLGVLLHTALDWS